MGGRIRSVPFAGGIAELGAQFIWGAESDIDGAAARQANPVTEVSGWLIPFIMPSICCRCLLPSQPLARRAMPPAHRLPT